MLYALYKECCQCAIRMICEITQPVFVMLLVNSIRFPFSTLSSIFHFVTFNFLLPFILNSNEPINEYDNAKIEKEKKLVYFLSHFFKYKINCC